MDSDITFLHAFNTIPEVGPATLRGLKNYFGTYESAWNAHGHALNEANIRQASIDSILIHRNKINPEQEREKLSRANITPVAHYDDSYPSLLNEIAQAPALLYVRGTTDFSDTTPRIGIVGTRKPTAYGVEATKTIVAELAQKNITIVSGLALGIDACAHHTTLTNTGKTFAVLGSGVDDTSLFPQANLRLARKIIDAGGALLSEYPPGTHARREYFPQRNRIISGLSLGILVVEARERSGALITARFALEQNRDVFALPGPIFSPASKGPNSLIREGASLITSASEMLEELGIAYTKEIQQPVHALNLTEDEKIVLNVLEQPLGIDGLRDSTALQTGALVATLSMLELKNLIRNLGGDLYQRV